MWFKQTYNGLKKSDLWNNRPTQHKKSEFNGILALVYQAAIHLKQKKQTQHVFNSNFYQQLPNQIKDNMCVQ